LYHENGHEDMSYGSGAYACFGKNEPVIVAISP
jgi:hypothetical protein